MKILILDWYLYIDTLQNLMRALDEMEKVNSQLSASVEEVTEAHRQKAEVFWLSSKHLLQKSILNSYLLFFQAQIKYLVRVCLLRN